ncbi:MAG: AbrB/MazE/SpoVT family DNA-binding domain-containing protein [Kiritimatiellia bacterium]|jgi:antitoxin MazE
MKAIEVKVARIGNSRGVRIPAAVLRRYAVGETLLLIESQDGILLRPKQQAEPKLPWAETARAMASEQEDWSEWDSTVSDGLDAVPWEADRVAEKPSPYRSRKQPEQRQE